MQLSSFFFANRTLARPMAAASQGYNILSSIVPTLSTQVTQFEVSGAEMNYQNKYTWSTQPPSVQGVS